MSKNKEMKQLLKEAEGLGFEVSMTRKCHYKLMHKKGIIIVSSTASDHRAFMNIRAEIRRVLKR